MLLLDKGANRMALSDGGNPPVVFAIFNKHTALAEILIDLATDEELEPTDLEQKSALLWACEAGSLPIVKKLFGRRVQYTVPDKKGVVPFHEAISKGFDDIASFFAEKYTAKQLKATLNLKRGYLHFACEKGMLQFAKTLLAKGVDATIVDEEGHTPLDLAVIRRNDELAVLLVEHATLERLNTPDANNETYLYRACAAGMAGFARALLAKGVNHVIRCRNSGLAALDRAICRNMREIAELLIEKSSVQELETFDIDGKTALHHACAAGLLPIVRKLAEKGVRCALPDIGGSTGLHDALSSDHRDIAHFLIGKYTAAELNLRTRANGKTALHLASARGQLETVRLLLNGGADRTLRDTNRGETDNALDLAIWYRHLPVAELLIQESSVAELETRGSKGRTALHYACEKGLISVIRALKAKKVSFTIVDNNQQTALMVAAEGGRTEIVKELVEQQSTDELNQANSAGKTILHIVAEQGLLPIIELLLDKGVALDKPDNKGNTATACAIQQNKEEEALFLIQNSPLEALNHSNTDGMTCLHFAAKMRLSAVVKALLERKVQRTLNNQNESALDLAITAKGMKSAELLIQASTVEELNVQMKGWTYLHEACRLSLLPIVRQLLDVKGLHVAVQDSDGNTALHLALQNTDDNDDIAALLMRKYSAAELLLENAHGLAAVHWFAARKEDYTASIEIAKARGTLPKEEVRCTRKQAIGFCKQGDVDVAFSVAKTLKPEELKAQEKDGKTFLHYSMKGEHFEFAEWLLQNNVDPLLADETGSLPFAFDSIRMPKGANRAEYLKKLTSCWNVLLRQFSLESYVGIIKPTLIVYADDRRNFAPLLTVEIADQSRFTTLLKRAESDQMMLVFMLAMLFQSEYLKNKIKESMSRQSYIELTRLMIAEFATTPERQACFSRFLLTEFVPSHVEKSRLAANKKYPQANAGTNLDTLLAFFDKINFANPQDKATYMSPADLQREGLGSSSREQIRGQLTKFINTIRNRAEITAAPRDPKKRQQFWERLENICKLTIERLQKLGPQDERQSMQVALHFAYTSYFCASRFKKEIERAYEFYSEDGMTRTIPEQALGVLNQLKEGAVSELVPRVDSEGLEPHTADALLVHFSDRYGTPKPDLDTYAVDMLTRWQRNPNTLEQFRSVMDGVYGTEGAIRAIDSASKENGFLEAIQEFLLAKRSVNLDKYKPLLERIEALRIRPLLGTGALPQAIVSELDALEVPQESYPATVATIQKQMKVRFIEQQREKLEPLLREAMAEAVPLEELPGPLREAVELCNEKIKAGKHPQIARSEAAAVAAKKMGEGVFNKVFFRPLPPGLNGKPVRTFIREDLPKLMPEIRYPNLDWRDKEKKEVVEKVEVYFNRAVPATSWEEVFQGREQYAHKMELQAMAPKALAEHFLRELEVIRTVE